MQTSLLDIPPEERPQDPDARRSSKGIAAGDIVEIDRKGRRFHALVTGLEQVEAGRTHQLTIRLLDRSTYRTATIREVVGVWRHVR